MNTLRCSSRRPTRSVKAKGAGSRRKYPARRTTWPPPCPARRTTGPPPVRAAGRTVRAAGQRVRAAGRAVRAAGL